MNTKETLNVLENIDVSKVDFPEIPKDIIFPDELNRFLREQIRYYAHENGMVKKCLSEIEFKYTDCLQKIDNLTSKLKNYETLSDDNDVLYSSKVAGSKIVQLSKKVREKNSEVETLKTKISKLEHYIYELKKKEEEDTVPEKEEKPVNQLEETIKKLQEKCNVTSNKLLEVKNVNCQLKNDMKLANKWLQQETGENFESLQSLNNSNNGNLRGRAQIICDLQQKNNELREKAQISNNRDTKSEVLRQKEDINKMRTDKDSLLNEIEEYKAIIKNMKKELDQKKESENNEPLKMNAISGTEGNEKTVNHSEAEHLRLLEFVEIQNTRLKAERDAHIKTQQMLRFERQRSAKAEANVARVQLESNTGRSSSYIGNPPIRTLDFDLRDQLELAEENIKALKTRLEIEQYERKMDLREFTGILRHEKI
ncbi:hypothetical protein NQ317_017924 [Molorchus minor]|uniref:Uncharacterized protein n=1 Tax=Molorchus minor TaxID=1323400 RepID=A0ABQ9J5E6_9CUCU|nr:hypothetical protein NQ317_017924 [Molorchus minor]